MPEPIGSCYREIGGERIEEFVSKGYKYRHVFPHRLYYLPKCGPDGFQLAQRMCGSCQLSQLWEIVLYAHPSRLSEFPEAIFFDDELCWHQQQFGRPGQVATANLVLRDKALYSMVHQSDLVQRASRQPALRTRLQNRFKGWNFMLLNAILNFAVEHNVEWLYTPTASWALRHTDPARDVQLDLFERIYDHQVRVLYRASLAAEWWRIGVKENQDRLIRPVTKRESLSREKIICLCHDIERGLGHLDSDPAFAEHASRTAPEHLEAMLSVERRLNVKATYNLVGELVPGLRGAIETEGHCLGFHSYDHRDFDSAAQLARCRSVDYRLKGYRPPQSKITRELSDENLCFHNFEWLANSTHSLDADVPRMQNRLVKIPIAFDDHPLYAEHMDWSTWERQALEQIEQHDFLAFSLHDCYGHFWLPHYERFLERVCTRGQLKTMNEVLNMTLMNHAV